MLLRLSSRTFLFEHVPSGTQIAEASSEIALILLVLVSHVYEHEAKILIIEFNV